MWLNEPKQPSSQTIGIEGQVEDHSVSGPRAVKAKQEKMRAKRNVENPQEKVPSASPNDP